METGFNQIVSPLDELEFEVTGRDQADNDLINIAEMSSYGLGGDYNLSGWKVNIPTRKDNGRTNGAWDHYVDKTRLDRFKVYMSGCERSSSQEVCEAMQLIESGKQWNSCTTVGLNLSNYVQGIEVTWTDESDNVIS